MMNLKKYCFVIMPFSGTRKHSRQYWDKFFSNFLKSILEKLGYSCIRSTPEPGNIIKGVIKDLVTAELVLAVLTDFNPNVWYELGIRHARKNGTIMIIEEGQKPPFDINQYGIIKYNYKRSGIVLFEKELKNFVEKIEAKKPVDNPVMDFLTHNDYFLELLRSGDISTFNEMRPNRHLNLDGVNLENAKLHKVNFSDTSLRKANIKGGDLTEANLTDANFDNANLANADFSKTICRGIMSFRNAIMDNTKFNEADLSGAHFFDASVKGVDFNKAYFKNNQQSLKDDLKNRGALNVPD